MMPSVDHCMSKSAGMTTLTNSLEVFDTYKHREDKDSDEESFHLPLDDDESDCKYQDAVVKNGTGNESEDEILNKFESATPTLEPIDSRLEERLLNDEEEEDKVNGTDQSTKDCEKDTTEKTVNGVIDKSPSENCTKSNETVVESQPETVKNSEESPEDKPPSQNIVDKSKNNSTETIKSDKPEVSDKAESDKHENSNDSSKSQNEDNEDLFDISIIRDAEEDNAESAYNEAHPEEDEDRTDDRMEEECNSDGANNLEEDEDQMKNDDVDIEETKLDCEGIKEASSSDAESDSGNKTDNLTNQVSKDQVKSNSETVNSVKDSTPDEGSGKLVDSVQNNVSSQVASDGATEKAVETDGEGSEKRKSLKRTITEEAESSVAKKSKPAPPPPDDTEAAAAAAAAEKPKEKLPLRKLLALSDIMKSPKVNKQLTSADLEDFCLQKLAEVIMYNGDWGDVYHQQLKLQEQLIEAMRKEIVQLTKQARDLEIVNKKLMNDLKQQNATQKPLNPLKITRSVGLQVKFTPACDVNNKRRQLNPALANQKIQVHAAPARSPRNIPNGPARQVSTPPKQPQQQPLPPPQQQLPKPNTPLLSQALQNRRAAPSDANKSTTQVVRPKVPDAKSPTASVIDLTDEDDKKDKAKNTPPKMVQKNIAVPLRTTPVRVNAAQGIRLTTSQGKVSPITSVVTSSTTPQLMYVVQSSPQNSLAPKAVVVNFQSTNGVLSSTLNGSAVSVIPKQSSTIQLKTVAPQKPLPASKINRVNKHPAPLPPPPVVRNNLDKSLKPIPPKPHLTIRKTETGIILQWKMPYELDMYEVIASYQLYAYQETSAMPSTDMWRKVGDVKALALPMACTLTQFADKNKYYFAVRPVDIHKRIGLFSEPEEISL